MTLPTLLLLIQNDVAIFIAALLLTAPLFDRRLFYLILMHTWLFDWRLLNYAFLLWFVFDTSLLLVLTSLLCLEDSTWFWWFYRFFLYLFIYSRCKITWSFIRGIFAVLLGDSWFLYFLIIFLYWRRLSFRTMWLLFLIFLSLFTLNIWFSNTIAPRIFNLRYFRFGTTIVFSFTGRFERRIFHFDFTLIILQLYAVLDRLLDSTFVITLFFTFWSGNHFFLHLGSLSFHPLELILILILFFFELVFYFLSFVDLLILIELSVAEASIWLLFCPLVLQTYKWMVIFASII